MKKVELLLPAGDEECLRAAVNNGADAVYLGLDKFNARQSAGNFNENNIASVIDYCHKRDVKVYVALNTLVKNNELEDYFRLIGVVYSAKADAVIIQDSCLVYLIKKNFPDIKIHLSTQATVTNSFSFPEGVDRTILARELKLEEIKKISESHETEIFVHGALCISYSGQCIFSSIVGGRSGNRGMCAQPCRRKFNNKYSLSTMDLCMLEKLPELIETGVSCLKIEGRMRSSIYVQTAARIYRKAIDSYYEGNFNVDEKDISDLKLVFNREFTTGFAFNDSIINTRKPMNRGLYIGYFQDGKLNLKESLKIGDGIGIWKDDDVTGYVISTIKKDNMDVEEAFSGDKIKIDTVEEDRIPVYKTSSVDMELELGDEISHDGSIFCSDDKEVSGNISEKKHENKIVFDLPEKINKDPPKIFVKVYNRREAVQADKAGADVVYYDLFKEDCKKVKEKVLDAKFFVFTPRILSDEQIKEVVEKIDDVKPDGVLVGNRGLLSCLSDYEIHLDYSFNCFNDVDLDCYSGIPIISPELNFSELSSFKNKNFIVLVHGDIVLMTTKEDIKAPELIDHEGRHFKVIKTKDGSQILNTVQIGLFSKIKMFLNCGIKYFYIDVNKNAGKFVDIYDEIIDSFGFDDSQLKKGYTTGHFSRGVL